MENTELISLIAGGILGALSLLKAVFDFLSKRQNCKNEKEKLEDENLNLRIEVKNLKIRIELLSTRCKGIQEQGLKWRARARRLEEKLEKDS